jgi:hypothetical protein
LAAPPKWFLALLAQAQPAQPQTAPVRVRVPQERRPAARRGSRAAL